MKEAEYDRIMRQGEKEYLELKKQGDPYAFHRAVEKVNRLTSSVNVSLQCDCGNEFMRPEKYQEFHKENPQVILWKWKLEYCDDCFNARIEKSLKRLPEIMKALTD